MKVRYIGKRRVDVVPSTGAREFSVDPGEVVEVDDKTGASLLAQPRKFERVTDPVSSPKGASKEEVKTDGKS